MHITSIAHTRGAAWKTLLTVMLICAAPMVFAETWGGSLGATSNYVFRGLTQSDNNPSVQGDVHYYSASGWFAGLWAASVKRDVDGATAEINGYVGYALALTDSWNGRVSAVHYAYPWNAPRKLYDYDELAGTLDYRSRLFLTASASPDTSAESTRGRVTDRAAFSYEIALRQPLVPSLSANAGVGYYDLDRLFDNGYAYWNAGLAYRFASAQLDVSYIGADGAATRLFGGTVARDRWVTTLLWHF